MRNLYILAILFFCLPVPSSVLCAQAQQPIAPASSAATTIAAANPKTPEEFFARAHQLSDLEAAGFPFHLKATFVASGAADFTGSGTFEEWWQSKNLWRKEATLGNYRWVLIHTEAKPSLYTSSSYIPLRLRQAVAALQIPTSLKYRSADKWTLQRKTLGGVKLTVVSAKYPNRSARIATDHRCRLLHLRRNT